MWRPYDSSPYSFKHVDFKVSNVCRLLKDPSHEAPTAPLPAATGDAKTLAAVVVAVNQTKNAATEALKP